MLAISADDLRRAVPMDAAIDAVADAFAQFSTGLAVVPLRTRLPLTPNDGLALLMPALLTNSGAFGVKALTIFPENPARRDIAAISALVLLFDATDGRPLALLDGAYLTALRTGAASGVATRLLAHPDAHTLALFGAGAQALPQALAVCVARAIDRIILVNRTPDRAERLAQELRSFGPPIPSRIEIAASAQGALIAADIVCTATSAPTPLFADADLRRGTHLNAIGAFQPDCREIPGETVGRARLVADSREAVLAEAGDLILALSEGFITPDTTIYELGALVAGRVPGRASDEEITLFKSVGLAVQDIAVAQVAYERVRTLGLGVEVSL